MDKKLFHSVVLLLGSNLGDKKNTIFRAIKLIKKEVGEVIKSSKIHETNPWGFKHENKFLNMAVVVESILKPEEILETILKIEKTLGRQRTKNTYEARCIDIDILFYDDFVLETSKLTIPHKLMHKRKFSLKLLAEIMPDFLHPKLKKTIKQLLKEFDDKE